MEDELANEKQPPHVLAMVLADTVLLDVATDKKTIQGTYSSIKAKEFPWEHPHIVVYVVLTEGYGATPLKLRLVDVDESKPPLFELDVTVDFTSPLSVREVVFCQSNVIFTAAGEYRVQLFGAGQPIKERRLQIGS